VTAVTALQTLACIPQLAAAMETVFEGKHLLVKETQDWQFVERKKGKTAVAVVALTDRDEVILTEQHRKPLGKRVIDYPAGLVGDEEGTNDPAETARKELEEETGYVCDSVEHLATGPSSPGITSELVSFYRARGVRREGDGGGVGGENITVHVVPRGELVQWLQKKEGEGVLIDLKLWGGLYFLGAAILESR
jgi:ADP-ribose pyrophosphatase